MFNYLIKGILSAVALKLLDNYRHLSVQLLRIEAAKSYVCGVRLARLSAIGLVKVGLLIGLISLGTLFTHAGLFILLPWTLKAKAVLGIVLGLAYVGIGGVMLKRALDERTWTVRSGAADMLSELQKHMK